MTEFFVSIAETADLKFRRVRLPHKTQRSSIKTTDIFKLVGLNAIPFLLFCFETKHISATQIEIEYFPCRFYRHRNYARQKMYFTESIFKRVAFLVPYYTTESVQI